jgi:UDP-2-acetamido-2-deoxy-ribo-hexuluronate aminotransferase
VNIAFIDLKKQFKAMESDIRSAIDGVLAHGRFIMGPEVGQLESELAEYAGTKHCVVCSSGTDALIMPLMAWDVGPGDAVFTTPFTFIATAEVISLLGATPVFVDIDPETFNIDPDKLRQAVEQVEQEGRLKPKCIIPVDLFGLPADYDPIMDLAREKGIFVLEDAAQGFGGEYKGRRAGALGHAAGTSFFPAKPLGCYGDGGAVFTDDSAFDKSLRSIRVHGQGPHKYENVRIGLNARMDAMQAAILLVKLAAFPQEIQARQKVAGRYTKKLSGAVKTPVVPEGYLSAWAQYSILTDNRDLVLERLKEAGVPTAVYYPKPLHLQKAYASLGYKNGDFPVSESMASRIFSLPMHPYLSEEEIDFVASKVIEAVNQGE